VTQSLIYGDLKPSNLLLDEDGTIKLGGLGLSRHLHHVNAAPVLKRPPVQSCMLSMLPRRAIARCCRIPSLWHAPVHSEVRVSTLRF
jgi:serine/threonine protein kinase